MTHKSSVVAAILESRHSAAVKALDTEIKAAQGNNSVLARLYLNRGTCHQKLGLYRKALKVNIHEMHKDRLLIWKGFALTFPLYLYRTLMIYY